MSRTATTLDNSSNSAAMRFKSCAYSRSAGGNPPPGLLVNTYTGVPYLEANSQEFKAGDMVYLNAGAVTQRLTAGTGVIAGFALTDATNVTTGNAQIDIMPVNDIDEYEMNVYASSAADTDKQSVALLVGGLYDLAQFTVANYDGSTTYCTAINLSSTTIPRVKIIDIVESADLTSSSQYIRVRCRFLSNIQTAANAVYNGLQL